MPGKRLRVVFMGCPDFAVPSLKHLSQDENFEIAAVYCMPDRPKGRGKKPSPTPVKTFAEQHGYRVETPASFRKDPEAIEVLRTFQPDFLVVVAYGLILPESVLAIPSIAPVNLHASILPSYRGPAPIHYALINGDKVTGNTVMLMSKGMDEGDILSVETTEISDSDNLQTLHDKLSKSGALQLSSALKALAVSKLTPTPQDHNHSTYTGKITPQTAKLDWQKPATQLVNVIRAMSPFPGAWFSVGEERIKVFMARALNASHDLTPGTIKCQDPEEGLQIACADNSLLQVLELQKAGKSRMQTRDFLRGCRLEAKILA